MLREEAKRHLRQLNQEVGQLYERGRYEQAIELATQSFDLARRVLGEAHPYFASSINNLGLLYKSMGNYHAAEPLLRQALEISRTILGEEHPDFATGLNNLANLYLSIGDVAAAEPLIRQALEVDRKVLGEHHPAYATDLNSLAELYRSSGNYGAAEPLYRQVMEIRRRAQGEEHPDFARSVNNLGLLYDSTNKFAAAEPLYRQALEIRRSVLGEEHPDFASSLNNLAAMHYRMGNYAAAEPLFREALVRCRRALGEEHRDFAMSLNNLARLYESMGNYGEAEPLDRQALEVYRRALGEGHPDFAISLSNLGLLCHKTGNYAAAELLLRQALDVNRKALGVEHPHFGVSLNNLGFLYRAMGNSTAAELLYREALEVNRKALGEEHSDYASYTNNLASLYESIGNYTAAEPLYRQSLEIRRRILGEKHPEFGASLNNLASLHESMGNYAAAEPLYRQALEVNREAFGEGHPDFASSLNNLAMFCYSLGSYTAAEPLFRQALEIRRKALGDEHPDVASTLNNLAGLCVAARREGEALVLMQQAAVIVTRMIGQVFSIGSESQRVAYIEETLGFFYSLLSLVAGHLSDSAGAVRAALELVLRRKAIGAEALGVQRDLVLGGKYPEVVPKLREITTLRTQIAQKTLAGPGVEGLQAHQQFLAEWNAQRERLEADLSRQVPEMNIEQKLRSIDRQVVAMALPTGATLVEFVRFDVFDFKAVPARGEKQRKPARYLAFVIFAGEPDSVEMIDLGEGEPIDRRIATFRESITGEEDEGGKRGLGALPSSARRTEGEDVGLRLREAIFDPLLQAVGARRRLMISPDGDLSRLPFEVLPTDDGRRLIDEYRISYLGAGRDVVRFGFKSNRKPSRSLVAADPDFDLGAKPMRADVVAGAGRRSRDLKREAMGTFERLPGTRREGENIAAMLDADLWTEGAALDARLKQCRSPRILHLATHGFFLEDQKREQNTERFGLGSMSFSESGMQRLADARFENPLLRSGLALAGVNTWLGKGELMEEAEDGLLTAEDVSGLDLLDTELVVLSACDTGLGEVRVGEGVFGLRRAFVLAGAKTLVTSLWKVPDEQTRELMEDFYRRILGADGKPPQSRADALREAQMAMKEKHPEPLYWGAFICQGYDGPLAAS